MKIIFSIFILLIFVSTINAKDFNLIQGEKYIVERENGEPIEALFSEEKGDYYVFTIGKTIINIYKDKIIEIVKIDEDKDDNFYFRFDKNKKYIIKLENGQIVKGNFQSQTDSTVVIKSGYADFNISKSDIIYIDVEKVKKSNSNETIFSKEESISSYSDYFIAHSNIPVNESHFQINLLFTDIELIFSPIKNLTVHGSIDGFSTIYTYSSLYSLSIAYNFFESKNIISTVQLKHCNHFEVDDISSRTIKVYDAISGFDPEFYDFNLAGVNFTYNDNFNFTAGIHYMFGTEEFESGLLINAAARIPFNYRTGCIVEVQDIHAYEDDFLLAMAGFYIDLMKIRLKLGVARYNATERVYLFTQKDKKWKSGDGKFFPVLGLEVSLDEAVGIK